VLVTLAAFVDADEATDEEMEEPLPDEVEDVIKLVVSVTLAACVDADEGTDEVVEEPPPDEGEDVTRLAVPPLAEAIEDPVALDVTGVEHDTADGRFVTPFDLQRFWAKVTAVCWSAALHTAARQHAIPPKKFELEQIHAISRLLHPAIAFPLAYCSTQGTAHFGTPPND